MTFWEAIVYGAVQGITEYLPVSSSAHLILLPQFLGTKDPGLAFDVFLHAGTLASTLIYFRYDWKELITGAFRKSGVVDAVQPLWKWVAIATLPALFAGALFHRMIEESLRGNWVMMITLVLGGILLWGMDRVSSGKKTVGEIGFREALGIGFFQCLALVPGMSRSGSTMMAGRVFGLGREAAARFSFLLSAPITAAALVFELRKWPELVAAADSSSVLLAGAVSSFLFGWLAIDGLLKVVKKYGYLGFAVYRCVLAAVIFFYLGC